MRSERSAVATTKTVAMVGQFFPSASGYLTSWKMVGVDELENEAEVCG